MAQDRAKRPRSNAEPAAATSSRAVTTPLTMPLGRLAEAAASSLVLQAQAAKEARLQAAWRCNQEIAQRVTGANRTGLPDSLKAGVEARSGLSLDDVKVHYNSSKPAMIQAHAYAQGTDIHLAPGQTKHLPHEAWHVVQQKQGRVKPTMTLGSVAINDDKRLEREADQIGSDG